MASSSKNPFAGMKQKKSTGPAPPAGVMDAFCSKWLGIPASNAARIVVLGVLAGAAMEAFMIKVWIGQTNCARRAIDPPPPHRPP